VRTGTGSASGRVMMPRRLRLLWIVVGILLALILLALILFAPAEVPANGA
jgi:hypothetical protein